MPWSSAALVGAMAAIDRTPLEFPRRVPGAGPRWDAFATQVTRWCAGRGIALRDAVVLLPFAQLLPAARAAFGRLGAWLPRIETTQTLARSLGPASRPVDMQLSGDRAADALQAAQILEGQAEGRRWAQRDRAGFDAAARTLADTALQIARAAAAVAPSQRAAHWERARQALAPAAGPGATERWLARIAVEWAAAAPSPATDRLFLLRPAAWIGLQAGGPDALALAVMEAAPENVPCLVVDADPAPERLLDDGDAPSAAYALCDSFEDEAQAAAAQVVAHVARGEAPVALVALDRVLVRRVRALLEAAGVAVADETGWRLSTTRAAARLMALLQAADPQAGTDALFDWLKALPGWPGESSYGERVAQLEAACRRAQIARVDALARQGDDVFRSAFCRRITTLLAGLGGMPAQPVGAWLRRLQDASTECGLMAALQSDEAGRQVLGALRLDQGDEARARWLRTAGDRVLGLDGLRRWIDEVLEAQTFRPAAPEGGAQAVITPLAQSIWRPFAAAVVPGASDRYLGAPLPLHPLLPGPLLRPLGLPDAEMARQEEAAAFSHLVTTVPVTLLRRHLDGPEPLVDSPLVERLRLELEQRGSTLADWVDPRVTHELILDPQPRPAPSAPELIPARISASAAEALRDCPYRFFAQYVLKLREIDELDAEVAKRDYGNWLHDVLRAFHTERPAPRSAEADAAALQATGLARRDALGLDEAEFVPFAASFTAFVPRYVEWLHRREAEGATWRDAESEFVRDLPGLPGTELYGRIDRIDHRAQPVPGDDLIDYKTSGSEKLSRRVREPMEDTQLAFYAALLQPQAEGPLRAMYLALDSSAGVEAYEHKDVETTAQALVEGLAHDLRRLREGAPMPALGSGDSCEYCAARGLCRRDHWSEELGASDQEEGA